jgi:hypothetical protein
MNDVGEAKNSLSQGFEDLLTRVLVYVLHFNNPH